jgi:hypothetical protein
MAIYQQSPGVQVVEKDASAVTVGLSTTIGAYVGAFQWGPVMYPMLISEETSLVNTFGTPDTDTYSHFYSVANFLSYTNAMWVNRVVGTTASNATTVGTTKLILNYDDYVANHLTGVATWGSWAARYPGSKGSGLVVSMADAGTFGTWPYKDQFQSIPDTSAWASGKGCSNDELHIIVVDALGKFTGVPGSTLEKFSFVSKATDAVSYQGTNNYYADVIAKSSQYIYWLAHETTVASNWGTSGIGKTFISLSDVNMSKTTTAGACVGTTVTLTYTSGTPFTVGETIVVAGVTPAGYNGNFVVTASNATTVSYVVPSTLGAATVQGTVTSTLYDFGYTLSGGVDANTPLIGDTEKGWDIFVDSQTYDISLLVTGNAVEALAAYVVQNIADVRRDCVAFTSICKTGAPILGTSSTRIADAKLFKTFDSSYAVIDSGYKYMYDKYNDKYRWIALNADTAGLCAKVDATNDTWFSPAGYTKGQIKGAIKLSWNPTQAERDQLYPASINPVINQVGKGTLLFGDKTATTKPSAFDRINVRRLFLVLEKSIANSAKYQLFEMNDAITRLQFVASVEPFLRDVKGRRGVQDYKVICDETNNTPQVVATNNFVGSILIKPQYSINFITLNFTAVGPNVSFDIAAGV